PKILIKDFVDDCLIESETEKAPKISESTFSEYVREFEEKGTKISCPTLDILSGEIIRDDDSLLVEVEFSEVPSKYKLMKDKILLREDYEDHPEEKDPEYIYVVVLDLTGDLKMDETWFVALTPIGILIDCSLPGDDGGQDCDRDIKFNIEENSISLSRKVGSISNVGLMMLANEEKFIDLTDWTAVSG
ncbi:unnamed protein product, partial [marine sediment metagenome]